MIWLTWRQFRVQAALIGAALVVVAIILLSTGPGLVHLYDNYLKDCAALHSCGSSPDPVVTADQPLQVALAGILLVMPALIGIFWGAPLIARELETGTHRLGWTQSVTRARWLWSKLAIVGVASALVGGLLTLMGTWWYTPIERANTDQFGAAVFSLRGLVPAGYALFAFALGLTLGVLIGRTLPAMASTLAAFVATRIVVTQWVRPHLLSPETISAKLGALGAKDVGVTMGPNGVSVSPVAPFIHNAWVYSARLADASGNAPTQHFLNQACAALIKYKPNPLDLPSSNSGSVGVTRARPAGAQIQQAFQQCGANVAKSFHEIVVLQPSNRYWPLQGLETLLYVVLAALLAGFSYWWLRHRVA